MATHTTSSLAPQAAAESPTGAAAAPAEPTAITAATSGFWFYDIESLSNAFTLCGLTAVPGHTPVWTSLPRSMTLTCGAGWFPPSSPWPSAGATRSCRPRRGSPSTISVIPAR